MRPSRLSPSASKVGGRPGAALPPAGTVDAALVLTKWQTRLADSDQSHLNLQGRQTTTLLPESPEVRLFAEDQPAFVYQSQQGFQIGDGRLHAQGLAREYARLHIKSMVIHFYCTLAIVEKEICIRSFSIPRWCPDWSFLRFPWIFVSRRHRAIWHRRIPESFGLPVSVLGRSAALVHPVSPGWQPDTRKAARDH